MHSSASCATTTQCQLQTNPITQLRVRYILTTLPHASHTLHCAVWSSLSQRSNFPLPFKLRYKLQSTHWNNGKMKIAYNTAYVETETSNFIFAGKPLFMFQLPRYRISGLFLPIISDCTLIASKKSIRPFTYTERLLLLVILVQTSQGNRRQMHNAQAATC